jgi:selenocysteine lyase/cysteine desulfurase
MPIDVAALDTDFLVCSPYKFFGPHLGLLYGKPERLDRLAAYKVRPAPSDPPGKWETGTLPGESIAGLLGTFEYLTWLGRVFGGAGEMAPRRQALAAAMHAVRRAELDLSLAALTALREVSGLRLRGIVDPGRVMERVPTFAFTVAGLSPRQIASELGRRGIAVWDGDYYAYELIRALGLAESGGMVRVGFVHYNEIAEIRRLVEELVTMVRPAQSPLRP